MSFHSRRVGIVGAVVIAAVIGIISMVVLGGCSSSPRAASAPKTSPSSASAGGQTQSAPASSTAAPTSTSSSATSASAGASSSDPYANDGANPSKGYGDNSGGASAPSLSPDTGMGKQVLDYTEAMLNGDSAKIKSLVTSSYYQQTVGQQVAPNPIQSAQAQEWAKTEGIPELDKSTMVMTESDQPGDTTHKVVLVHYRTCSDRPDGQRVCTPPNDVSYFYVKSGNQWLLNDVSA